MLMFVFFLLMMLCLGLIGNYAQRARIPNGTLSCSYNIFNKILVLNVAHASPARIVVDWRTPSDVDGDSLVDIPDLALVGEAYGSTSNSSNWNENADLNVDDVVNVFDLVIVSKNYGTTPS